MLYVVHTDSQIVKVVNSKTLDYENMSYEKVYETIESGTEIKNLIYRSLHDGSRTYPDVTPDLVEFFKGVEYAEDGNSYIDFSKGIHKLPDKLPIFHQLSHFLTFGARCQDIIIEPKNAYYSIWYRGKRYLVDRFNVGGIYRDEDEIILYMFKLCGMSTHIVMGKLEQMLPDGIQCGLNEFKRLQLLE